MEPKDYPKEFWEQLAPRQWLEISRAFLKKMAELALDELDRDLARIEALDFLDQVYLRAYWSTVWGGIAKPLPVKLSLPADSLEQLDAQVAFLEEFFHIQLRPPRPSGALKVDVAKRMEWLKQNVAKEFEQGVFGIVDRHNIVSPIEQIFLMEWCFAKVEDRYHLKLEPQKPIQTSSGEFFLDYLVTSSDDSAPKFAVAIELDGHDFHEKTKDQAAQDKRRERAILHAGVKERLTVLRFSGAEVVRNCKNCIREITKFIETMRQSASSGQ